jgi:methionyl-tRNA formyltransferase
MLKYIYFGTPEISKSILEYLHKNYGEPVLVITNLDKKSGRGLSLTPSPVKKYAEDNNLKVITPEKLKDHEEYIMSLKADVGVLFAYGKIIPEWLINSFPKGIINIHPSLLPYYRGPSPIEAPILNSDSKTGITIMDLVKELDAGDIYTQKEYSLGKETTRENMVDFIEKNAGDLVISTLNELESNSATKTPQDKDKVTHTKKWDKNDAYLDYTKDHKTLVSVFNAFIGSSYEPWTKIKLNDKVVRIKIKSIDYDTGLPKTIIPEGKNLTNYNDYIKNAKHFEFLTHEEHSI